MEVVLEAVRLVRELVLQTVRVVLELVERAPHVSKRVGRGAGGAGAAATREVLVQIGEVGPEEGVEGGVAFPYLAKGLYG
eukprot:scaffold116258_cov63-Phaeocystis_antarctica.AAC.3